MRGSYSQYCVNFAAPSLESRTIWRKQVGSRSSFGVAATLWRAELSVKLVKVPESQKGVFGGEGAGVATQLPQWHTCLLLLNDSA